LKRAALALGFCSAIASATSARAQTAETLGVQLQYRAFEGCPDAAAFRAQVLARTHRLTFEEDGTRADVAWSVTLAETSNGARGALRVRSAKLGRLERQVTAASCAQVASALSLVAALSVDPEASLTVPEEPTPAKPPTKPPATPPPFAQEPALPTPHTRRETKLSLGLTLTGQSGVAPRLSWAPRPFVGLSLRSPGGYTWGLAVSAMQVHGSAAVDVGRATFTWSLGRLEAFPLRLGYGNLRLEPALFFEAGQLRARGVAVTPTAEVRRPAFFAGALGRVSYLAFDVLVFVLEGGPRLSLERDRFYLYENNTVFRIPTVTGYAAAGVGLEFL
jgi:hypothetical protein